MVTLRNYVEAKDYNISQDEFERLFMQNMEEFKNISKGLSFFSIIVDYYKLYDILSKKDLSYKMIFHENIFVHILSKIKSLNPKNWIKENKEFTICRYYIIRESSAFNIETGKAVSLLFGDSFLENTNLSNKTIFYEFISVYIEIFVNLHQYRKVTIENSQRIAKSYFFDLEKIYGNSNYIIYFNKMRDMLEKIVSDILNNERYRK
jgi:hypothetical protein